VSEIINEGCYNRKIEIATVRNSKDKVFVSVLDLVIAAMDAMSSEEKKEFYLKLLSWKEAADAFVECLEGCGHDESDNNLDKLRKLCTFGANDAVKTLVSNALEAAERNIQKLENCMEYIEELRKAWPTGFEKYFPKNAYFFPKWTDRSEEARKLLEEATK